MSTVPVLFIGAGPEAVVGAGEKIPGAGQKRTGSATLLVAKDIDTIRIKILFYVLLLNYDSNIISDMKNKSYR